VETKRTGVPLIYGEMTVSGQIRGLKSNLGAIESVNLAEKPPQIAFENIFIPLRGKENISQA
jgi:hypothetical protein